MARFSQQFLRSMTQPSFQEGLFTAARQLGGLRGQLEQERGAMQRFDQLSKATGQAQASALSGDPNALALNIRRLEEIRDAAPTLQEKQAIDSRISQLRSMAPAAKQAGLKRDITAASQIDNVLDGLDARADISEQQKSELKESLTLRKNQLLENPEIEQGYRQDQVNAFQFEQQELAMRESQYIRDNAKTFLDAIDTGDQAQIDTAMKAVPQEFRLAADKYVTGAIRNNEIKREFKERSIAMRTKPMTEAELQTIVDQLPEDVRENVAPLVQQYRDAAKGWSDSTGQWTTDGLNKAKAAEKALQSRIATLTDQVLLRELDTERDQEIREERDILRLELELAAPLDRMAVKDEEMRLAGQDKNKITPEITEQAKENIRNARDSAILDQIEILSETRASEIATERSPYEKGQIIPDEDGNVFYRFEGGDYRDESNYTEVTAEEAGYVSKKQESLEEVLELFALKDQGELPPGKVDDYVMAFVRYGNPDRARRVLGNGEE